MLQTFVQWGPITDVFKIYNLVTVVQYPHSLWTYHLQACKFPNFKVHFPAVSMDICLLPFNKMWKLKTFEGSIDESVHM